MNATGKSGISAIGKDAIDHKSPARRNFLLGAGAATVAGAAAVVVVVAVKQPPGAVKTSKASVPEGRGYRLSEHVRSYYRTTTI